MIKKINIIILIFSLGLTTQAQEWLQKLPNKKAQEVNFYDYQTAFYNYWAPVQVDKNGYYQINGKKKKAAGWKQFKRWEWKMESQINPQSGAFPQKSAQQVYEEFMKTHPDQRQARSANWTSLGPQSSTGGYAGVGRINCVAFHPTDMNHYWIGAPAGGLWETTDNGNSWTCLTDDNDVLGVSDILIPSDFATSNTIYIATGDKDGWDTRSIGVLKSTDGGNTWNTTGLSFDLADAMMVTNLIVDPSDNQTILAATNDGVFKTTNGGTTWSDQLTSHYFIDLEYKPGDFNTLYGSTKWGKIYQSTNGGNNWTKVFDEGNRIELTVSPASANLVYAIVVDDNSGLYGIYQSSNSGSSFSQIFSGSSLNLLGYSADGSGSGGQGWYDLSFAASPNNANTLLVGGVNTWRSTDGGSNWSLIAHWWGNGVQAVHADIHMIRYRDNGDVFECNDGGIYFSNDNGSNFSDITNGIVNSEMYKLSNSQTVSDEVIAGLQDNGTKLRSGGNWDDVKGGDGMECLIDYTNVNIQYGTYTNGQISRTTNHWVSSTAIEPSSAGDGAWVTPFIISPNDHNTLYAGYADIWKTTNKGNNWTKISSMNSGEKIRSMAIAASNTQILYVADNNHIWKTTNDGSSWTDITGNLPLGSSNITYITVKDDDANTLWITLSGYNNENVFESTNGGSSWSNISSGLPAIPARSIVQNKQITGSVHLYIGTELGVYFKNGSDDWIEYNTGLPKVKTGELEIYYDANPADSKLRLASYGRGMWESSLEQSGSATPNATATATPGCNTGTVRISSDLSGTQTFYLTNDNGSILNNATADASFYDFTNLNDGIYRGKVEKDGNMSSLSSPITLTNLTNPDQPSTISGNTSACANTQETYSVTNVTGLTYAWTLPAGWTGSSNTNIITLSVGNTGGTLSVIASNSCGNSIARTLTINVIDTPSQPSPITGNINPCSGESISYSVTNDANVDSYSWVLPNTWTGSSTTNSINVSVGSVSGNIEVSPNNSCGTGTASTLAVSPSTTPSQPDAITGNNSVCEGTQETYSVNNDPEVDSYLWTLPSGWTGSSSSNSITVTVGANDGNISVTPSNTCGNGAAQSLAIIVSNTGPNQPGAINGDFSTCAGNNETYSVPNDAAVTSYAWTLPSGWTGSSNTNTITVSVGNNGGEISVVPSNLCGSGPAQTAMANVSASTPSQPDPISGNTEVCYNTTEAYSVNLEEGVNYTWLLPSGWAGSSSTNTITCSVGNSSGDITVIPANGCGVGDSQSQFINVSEIPFQPNAISGETEVCVGSNQVYEVENQDGASFNWVLPNGWSGSSNTNSITVTVGSDDGDISVTASNMCGESAAESLTVIARNILNDPGSISGTTEVCAGDNAIGYSVTPMEDAATYYWTIPSGADIIDGEETASILVNYYENASSGELSVQAENICGLSSVSTINIDVNHLPDNPGIINGENAVIEGSAYTYYVEDVNGAESYNWILDPSWNLQSGEDSNEIDILFPLGAQSGILSVNAVNTCGNSELSSLEIDIIPLGIDDMVKTNDILIYPNPSKRLINISLNTSLRHDLTITVNSLSGKLIYTTQMKSQEKQMTIDLKELPAGSYLMSLENADIKKMFKIVLTD